MLSANFCGLASIRIDFAAEAARPAGAPAFGRRIELGFASVRT